MLFSHLVDIEELNWEEIEFTFDETLQVLEYFFKTDNSILLSYSAQEEEQP
jgi:hypothetical protein